MLQQPHPCICGCGWVFQWLCAGAFTHLDLYFMVSYLPFFFQRHHSLCIFIVKCLWLFSLKMCEFHFPTVSVAFQNIYTKDKGRVALALIWLRLSILLSENRHLGWAGVWSHLRYQHPKWEFLDLASSSGSWFQLMWTIGCIHDGSSNWAPDIPTRDLDLGSWFPPRHHRHLGSRPEHGSPLSVSVS